LTVKLKCCETLFVGLRYSKYSKQTSTIMIRKLKSGEYRIYSRKVDPERLINKMWASKPSRKTRPRLVVNRPAIIRPAGSAVN
jgi:hypothetical protein